MMEFDDDIFINIEYIYNTLTNQEKEEEYVYVYVATHTNDDNVPEAPHVILILSMIIPQLQHSNKNKNNDVNSNQPTTQHTITIAHIQKTYV